MPPEQVKFMAAIGDVVRETQRAFEGVAIPDARLEAEIIVTNVLQMPRQHLYAYREEELTSRQEQLLRQFVERRLKREPLAYILGHKEFYGLDLAVGPGVLVPRPETELLVEQALFLSMMRMESGDLVIAEPGTGSGAVSVNLAIHLPMARIYATELHPAAMNVARFNVRKHNVADRVTLIQGSLLEPVQETADIIVANLPYVPSGEIATLQPEIQWEPREALDGGPDGLDVIRSLLQQSHSKIKDTGVIILEIDPRQVQPLEELAREIFPSATTITEQDLAHLDRVFMINLNTADR